MPAKKKDIQKVPASYRIDPSVKKKAKMKVKKEGISLSSKAEELITKYANS